MSEGMGDGTSESSIVPGRPIERLAFSATVFGEVDQGVLLVTIDNPPVNAAATSVRAGLLAAIGMTIAAPAILAIVIAGTGKSFVGGADIREFDAPPAPPLLPDVVAEIEACSKPVVAAINGVALGGGLELALACHARIAAPKAKLGLPEVKLGVVPGAGGTQRLPRLTGIVAAIDLIGSGRIVDAGAAQTFGIVDRLSAGDLVDEARELALALVGSPLRRTGGLSVPPEPVPAVEAAEAKVLARSRGQSALAAAVRLVRAAAETPLADALAEERRTFLALRASPEAAALRYVFFAERAAGKVDGLDDVAALPVSTVGIVGLGLMGAGIAVAALEAGFTVVGVESTAPAAEAGRIRIAGLIDRAVKSGRLSAADGAVRLARLTTTTELVGLADADIVIEAVFDDLEVKTQLFQSLQGVVRPNAVLATNTSYLDPDGIAAAVDRPEQVVGLHFFSPANVMRLAEVVRCAKTSPTVLATALSVARAMGKLPIVCGVTEGFIGNRVFSAYRRAGEFLVEDGASPYDVDAAIEAFGLAMGPFAVSDLAGLEIAWARRKRQAATRDPAERYVDFADRLCEAGRFGQKVGRGWYAYVDGKRQPDPEVDQVVAAARAAKGIVPRAVAAEEIVERLVAAMAEEGEKLLAAGIAARSSDIDLVMINGYGFPAHKGGPMFIAEQTRKAARPT
ncbi:MAG: 3-hydroxyacyl-CoA dehydrogenase NAD-binding domain-containing protein [Ancalomicrobiaceae bacterium]|nr:3-hydroxyacyl-CoA dehydrogenase NAD-binding domain-containing protein [Ancalomicrobiaceae bacterium]